ncbi:dihydroxyacetone kinase, L subunit [[Clostridium] asparagiforme DSM 15981]|uniref:Dihydroxyacetone kinase, L subunit n=1 Tax=[Clostridium] asparagiforme DSM 15981 TaxID=518636 RepID=C0D3Z1_9FIRM|nr:dihydroxyacetone kinase, L subunit [[Clostridium] asparagiforme DSM 15981]
MADTKKVLEILRAMGRTIADEKDYLTRLDQPIGDSDHGINLDRGFQAVEQKLPGMEEKDIGSILKDVGMTLVSTVGGASGPLYGSAFMKAGAAAAGKTEVDAEDFLAMLDAAVEAVKKRGRAQVEEGDHAGCHVSVPGRHERGQDPGRRRRPHAGSRREGGLGGSGAHQRSGRHQRAGQLCGRAGTGPSGPGGHVLLLSVGDDCTLYTRRIKGGWENGRSGCSIPQRESGEERGGAHGPDGAGGAGSRGRRHGRRGLWHLL